MPGNRSMTEDTVPQNNGFSFRRALPWLVILAGVFYLTFVCRLIFSPLMNGIEAEMAITHARAGRFFLYISLGYSVALLCSGFLSSRITHRRTIAVSTIWSGLTLLGLAASTTLPLTEALLLAYGVGSGLYLPSGVAAVTSLVAPRDYGKAMAVHELAPTLSFLTAPLLAELFLAFGSWRTGLAILGAMAIVAGLLFAFYGRGGEFKSTPPSYNVIRTIVRRPAFWVLACFFCMAIGGSLGTYTILPLFLVDEHGMLPSDANDLQALSRISGPFVVFTAGWVADRLGFARTMAYSLGLAALATIVMGLTGGGVLIAAAILQPLLLSCYFPAGFVAVSKLFPAEVRSVVVSLIIPLGILIGGGLLPAFLGYLGDQGQFGLGFVLVGAFLAVGPFLVRFLDKS